MKYSSEQTNHHIDIIYDIVSKDTSMSARALCYYLKEKGYNLNRAYATKLMWKAFERLTKEQTVLREKRPQFDRWKERLEQFSVEMAQLRQKLNEIIREYPGDWIDPRNRHDGFL